MSSANETQSPDSMQSSQARTSLPTNQPAPCTLVELEQPSNGDTVWMWYSPGGEGDPPHQVIPHIDEAQTSWGYLFSQSKSVGWEFSYRLNYVRGTDMEKQTEISSRLLAWHQRAKDYMRTFPPGRPQPGDSQKWKDRLSDWLIKNAKDAFAENVILIDQAAPSNSFHLTESPPPPNSRKGRQRRTLPNVTTASAQGGQPGLPTASGSSTNNQPRTVLGPTPSSTDVIATSGVSVGQTGQNASTTIIDAVHIWDEQRALQRLWQNKKDPDTRAPLHDNEWEVARKELERQITEAAAAFAQSVTLRNPDEHSSTATTLGNRPIRFAPRGILQSVISKIATDLKSLPRVAVGPPFSSFVYDPETASITTIGSGTTRPYSLPLPPPIIRAYYHLTQSHMHSIRQAPPTSPGSSSIHPLPVAASQQSVPSDRQATQTDSAT